MSSINKQPQKMAVKVLRASLYDFRLEANSSPTTYANATMPFLMYFQFKKENPWIPRAVPKNDNVGDVFVLKDMHFSRTVSKSIFN